ncbi:hypothetical protein CBW65_18610 [Tumebacillus avium]|uniref:Calcineurin-like phosphoesterase domain-containing protein n=1 Tax=Tumebacillus avium TaxID=1903704 RepID=A0A1Y0ITE9_9BACL|nr:hypothetical protein CBW65_18610 [Tumebacillus avium]
MPTFIGDIHGQYDKMITNLRADVLIDETGKWSGGTRRRLLLCMQEEPASTWMADCISSGRDSCIESDRV